MSREGWQRPNSWSAAHRVIAFYEQSAATGEDIYLLHADGQDDPIPFVPGPGDQRVPTFSPDGRWIAYASNETGVWDVYVAEYPSGRKEAVSIGGGREPIWSRDGKMLFYRSGNKMMEVEFDASGEGLSLVDRNG